jgi:hypothetical protein
VEGRPERIGEDDDPDEEDFLRGIRVNYVGGYPGLEPCQGDEVVRQFLRCGEER